MCHNAEGLTISNVHRSLIEERCTEDILAACRLYLIHAKRGENVPCRHLTHILVTTQTIEVIVIQVLKYIANLVRSLPRLTHIVVHIEDMMAWFVTVSVLTNQTSDVW